MKNNSVSLLDKKFPILFYILLGNIIYSFHFLWNESRFSINKYLKIEGSILSDVQNYSSILYPYFCLENGK